MTSEKNRRAFISYSRVNKEFATKLSKGLRTAGYPVWFDLLDIPTGSRWDDEVEKALRECSIFMIILTPASIASENVKDEIGYAIDHGKRILPVLLEDCDVPLRLRRFQHVDFTTKSFEEGFESAKELLGDLIEEVSTPIPNLKPSEEPPLISQSAPVKAKPAPPVQASEPPVVKPAEKKPPSMGLLIGIGAVVLLIIGVIGFSILSKSGASNPSTQQPTQLPTQQPTQQPANSPAPNSVEVLATNTQASAPTLVPDTSTPEPQPFYMEEFNGDLSHWTSFVTSGEETRFKVRIDNGAMVFDLSDSATDLKGYNVLNDFTYTDVQLDAVAINQGINNNNVSLICRYSEKGWYEFNIANNGLYSIYAYNSVDSLEKRYHLLADGASQAIKSGQATNTYTATCKGNKLTLFINDIQARSVIDNLYNFDQGKIGLAVYSFRVLPVSVSFESLKISKP